MFQALGTQAPVALALWVGVVSQFLPVVGTYLAGVLPVLVTFIDSPLKALIVLIFVVVYQQIENYLFAAAHHRPHDGAAPGPRVRCGARGCAPCWVRSVPCWRFPAAAMAQALLSDVGAAPRGDRQPPHRCVTPSRRREVDAGRSPERTRTADADGDA